MKRYLRSILLWGALLAMVSACGKTDKPMPLTKENLTQYLNSSRAVSNGFSPQENKAAMEDKNKRKELILKAIVAPMEKMGYNYDKTIHAVISGAMTKSIKPTDPAMAAMLNEVGNFAINYKEEFLSQGIISADTKALLDRAGAPAP